MGNIGDSISDTAPAVGTAGPGYASTVNSLLTEFKNRLTALIPMSSLLLNSDLNMNGQAITNAEYLTLLNTVATPGASPVNRWTAFGGNAYWVGPSGAVQITNGAALNSASLGGITGDYVGAGPMQFRYDAANTRYDAFSNQSTNTFAYVRARGFDVAASATSNFRARIAFGGGASVVYTLPAAAPAASAAMKMDSAGNITTSTTVTRTIRIPVWHAGFKSGGGQGPANLTATEKLWHIIDIPVGSVITSWTLNATKTTNATNTMRANILTQNTSGVTSAFGTQQTNNANNPGAVTLGQSGVTLTVGASDALLFEFEASALSGGGVEQPFVLQVVYNEPAV